LFADEIIPSAPMKTLKLYFKNQKRINIMGTIMIVSEKKAWEALHEDEISREKRKTIKQKSDLSSQKNFRVVDLWKIRGMKKYFNYQ
jgi:hypothetical protein